MADDLLSYLFAFMCFTESIFCIILWRMEKEIKYDIIVYVLVYGFYLCFPYRHMLHHKWRIKSTIKVYQMQIIWELLSEYSWGPSRPATIGIRTSQYDMLVNWVVQRLRICPIFSWTKIELSNNQCFLRKSWVIYRLSSN